MVNGTETPLRSTGLYLNDTIGLQDLDKRGDLHLLELPGDHVRFEMRFLWIPLFVCSMSVPVLKFTWTS
jgi:hypothetical protein